MNNKKKIGKILADLRGCKSRREIASELGISISAIGMYETGNRVPRDEMKLKLAKYYNKTVEQIFFT